MIRAPTVETLGLALGLLKLLNNYKCHMLYYLDRFGDIMC